MALKNYYTKEEHEMQELVQKQIDLAGFGGEGFTEKQVNQIHEYAQMVGDELRVRSLIWNVAGANDRSDQERITQLMDDCYTISISKHETKQIKYSDIIAFRCIKSSHYIAIDTITDLYRQRSTINTLCDALPDYFLQTNRSTIMNINHIQSISQKDITGSNDLIYPLSIEYADDVKNVGSDLRIPILTDQSPGRNFPLTVQWVLSVYCFCVDPLNTGRYRFGFAVL